MADSAVVPVFRGESGSDCEEFIRSIYAYAFEKDKADDDKWIATYAATRLSGMALRWFARLDPSVKKDWTALQVALLDQYPPAYDWGSITPSIQLSPSNVPTPDAAPPSSAMASHSVVPAFNDLSLTDVAIASFAARPNLPPTSANTEMSPVLGPLSSFSNQSPAFDTRLPSALASARKIDDLDSVTYPEGIMTPSVELNRGQEKGGKYKYDRDFLMQFMQICKNKPDNLSDLDGLGIERGAEDDSIPSFRSRGRRMGSMGPPPGRSASENLELGLIGFPGSKGGAPFVSMGKSASKPLTSAERFAAGNRPRVVGGLSFTRGVPMSKSSDQAYVDGTSGSNAVPPSRRKKNRTARGP